MATMQLKAAPAGGGLNTIQDLYNIINGKTTTTSVGTQTTTDSTNVSKEGMDAMLSNVLSGNTGLAAVSSGQRNAGGYGSATNTLLTNDLLTRSAAQIAALNSTKTSTTTKAPTTKTTGGLTGSGINKSLAVLAGIKSLGVTSKSGDELFKKVKDLFGNSSEEAGLGAGENAASINAVNGSDMQSDTYVANNYNDTYDVSADLSFGEALDQPQFNVVEDMLADPTFDTSTAPVEDYVEDYSGDYTEFFADGGLVDSGKAIDEFNRGGSGSHFSNPDSSNYGSLSGINGSKVGKALGIVGTLMGNSDVSNVGKAIGVASSDNPLGAAFGIAANKATKGLYGAVNKAVANDFSAGTIADIAMSLANPMLGVVNGIADLAGVASIGQIGVNMFGNVGVNDPVGPDQQASVNADNNSIANGGTFGGDSDNTNASSMNAVNGSDSMSDSGQGFGGFGGTSDSNSNSGYGGGMNNSAGDGDGEGSTSAADGGHITGPGTEISDSIDAKLSDGEFVLSADVVKAIGVDKLQALQDKYHVPAAVQKLNQFRK